MWSTMHTVWRRHRDKWHAYTMSWSVWVGGVGYTDGSLCCFGCSLWYMLCWRCNAIVIHTQHQKFILLSRGLRSEMRFEWIDFELETGTSWPIASRRARTRACLRTTFGCTWGPSGSQSLFSLSWSGTWVSNTVPPPLEYPCTDLLNSVLLHLPLSCS